VLIVSYPYSAPPRISVELIIEEYPALIDRVRCRDFVHVCVAKEARDDAVWVDAVSKNVGKRGVEVVRAVEIVNFVKVAVLVDAFRSRDWRGIVIPVRDCIVDEGYLSKGFRLHFRELWIFVRDYGPFREFGKRVLDSVRIRDFKGFVLYPRDVVYVYDYYAGLKLKEVIDSLRSVDRYSKAVMWSFVDVSRVEEWVDRLFPRLLELTDVVSATDRYVKRGVFFRDYLELVAVSDWVRTVFGKIVMDVVTVLESRVLVGRGFTRVLVDRFVDEGYVAKLPSRGVFDEVVADDFLVKVAFTLFGQAARRVYFHKVHGDIILPDDHNVRNIAAQALVEAVKRLKDKLG